MAYIDVTHFLGDLSAEHLRVMSADEAVKRVVHIRFGGFAPTCPRCTAALTQEKTDKLDWPVYRCEKKHKISIKSGTYWSLYNGTPKNWLNLVAFCLVFYPDRGADYIAYNAGLRTDLVHKHLETIRFSLNAGLCWAPSLGELTAITKKNAKNRARIKVGQFLLDNGNGTRVLRPTVFEAVGENPATQRAYLELGALGRSEIQDAVNQALMATQQ